ncbi:MAG TPA: glucosidase [bacterium]|nr:glucosidase [bacterium]
MPNPTPLDPESQRLELFVEGNHPWKKWGPYLSERQWGTVREDYSPGGTCWDYFPHDHARSRAYRWGEDGLLGLSDSKGLVCFAPALWNGKDPILKERLFGLSGPEGNHGEDVKECYYYLRSSPTHSYMKALYKYPQAEFPYARLVAENRARGRGQDEFELLDTGIFNDNRYFDVFVEYAKAAPDDILIRFTLVNRGPQEAPLHLLPTWWLKNTWAWGRRGEHDWPRVPITKNGKGLALTHPALGPLFLRAEEEGEILFTENETNFKRLFNSPNPSPYVKDAFHDYVIQGRKEALGPGEGTKAAFHFAFSIPPGGQKIVRLRLSKDDPAAPFGAAFDQVFEDRWKESEAYYDLKITPGLAPADQEVAKQASAGLLWSKQYYYYFVKQWLEGDPAQPPVDEGRQKGRNRDWGHFGAEDVFSMPDKWEYPWFAAWDLAFHMIPFARLDPFFAKHQLVLLLREWYMHPNGQIPAYEFAFSDVNPPLHAWAAWRVYKMTAPPGQRDRVFLSRVFQKLLLNFTWWVNRKDAEGNNLFAGGFLGLDNIGVFDRGQLSPGQALEQADGTAWMAFYCGTLLSMALELSLENTATEDMATKFFEHYLSIVHAINTLGGTGLWDDQDGFYYDQLLADGTGIPLRIRSAVGLIPLFAAEILDEDKLTKLPEFYKRMKWFMAHKPEEAGAILCRDRGEKGRGRFLLAVPSRDKLERVLRYVLDEKEFLSPYGIRMLSKYHQDHPYRLQLNGREHRVDYEPGESRTGLFGGNSNWRGPVWMPINYLLIESLERYHHFYGDDLKVECPTGSGNFMNLKEVALFLSERVENIFRPDEKGDRPCHGGEGRYAKDEAWKDLLLFYEYFHGDNGKGLGASHQTGWTALVAKLLEGHDHDHEI